MFESDLLADAAQLRMLADRIAATVTPEVNGALAVEALTEVMSAVRAGELATVRLIERIDRSGEFAADGSGSAVAFVRGMSGETDGWISQRVQLGRALADRMPATAAGWQRGELGLTAAHIIRRATDRLEDELAADIEKVLAEAAPHITPKQLSELAETIKAQTSPDESDDAAAKKRNGQTLSLSASFDGMVRIDGWLDPEAGAVVRAAIDAFTRKREPGLSAWEDPIGLRRAQALLELARQATAHSEGCGGQSGGRHTVVVTTTLAELRSGIGTATLIGGGLIPAAAARRMACDAGILPVVLGTESEIVDQGRLNRLASGPMRQRLALRDGGCLWPCCDRPPAFTQAHHRKHHVDGGETTEENLDSFCEFHHHLLHEGGWTYRVIDAHTLHFQPPDGGPVRVGIRKPLVRSDDLSKLVKPPPTVRTRSPLRT